MAPRTTALRQDELARLLAVPPAEFVATRNDRAKELRAAGDREGANVVSHLRRPSVATWGVNAAARADPDGATALVDAVRALQQPGSTDVRAATRALDDALDRLVDAAAGALREIGTEPTADRRAQVRDALRTAALADDPAPLLEARLLDADADPDATLEAALRAGASGRGARGRATRTSSSSTSDRERAKREAAAREQSERRERLEREVDAARAVRDEAKQAVRVAERELRSAERDLATAERRLADLD